MAGRPRKTQVSDDSPRADLLMLRRQLRTALKVAEPHQLAALSRELRAVNAELASIPEKPAEREAGNVVDLTAAAARKKGTAGQQHSAGS